MDRKHIIACTLAVPFLAAQSWAQTGAPPTTGFSKVAVLNIQAVIAGSKDGQMALQQLQAKFGPKQKEMQTREAELQQLNDQLQKGGNLMSEDKRNDLTHQIDEKNKRYQRDFQDAQDEVQQEQQKLLGSIAQRVMPVIEKYAKDNGYTLVLDTSSPNTPVMYVATSNEITKDVTAMYDKVAPSTPAAAPRGALSQPGAASAERAAR